MSRSDEGLRALSPEFQTFWIEDFSSSKKRTLDDWKTAQTRILCSEEANLQAYQSYLSQIDYAPTYEPR